MSSEVEVGVTERPPQAAVAGGCADLPPLRLLAQDPEDLVVMSAALQDGVLTPADIRWEPAHRRLTVALRRFRWEGGDDCARVEAGLQLGDVSAVQSRHLPRLRDAALSLLALEFQPTEAPGGHVYLVFAGGGDLRVKVDCIDAVLADLSAPWPARREPCHKRAEA